MVRVWCMTQDTQSQCSVTTGRDRVEREVGGGFRREGTHNTYGQFMLMYHIKPSHYCNYSSIKIKKTSNNIIKCGRPLTYSEDGQEPVVITKPLYCHHFSEHKLEKRPRLTFSSWLSCECKTPDVHHCWFRESGKLSWDCTLMSVTYQLFCTSNWKQKVIWWRPLVHLMQITNY